MPILGLSHVFPMGSFMGPLGQTSERNVAQNGSNNAVRRVVTGGLGKNVNFQRNPLNLPPKHPNRPPMYFQLWEGALAPSHC